MASKTSRSGQPSRGSYRSLVTPVVDLIDCKIPVRNTFVHFKLNMDETGDDETPHGLAKRSRSADSGGGLALNGPRKCCAASKSSSTTLSVSSGSSCSLPPYSDVVGSLGSLPPHSEVRPDLSEERLAAHNAALINVSSPPGNWLLPNGTPFESADPSRMSSWGAAGHDQGICRPCAWNWKPAGCSNGRQCTFCHTCDADAIFVRRRNKNALMKKEKQLAEESMESVDAMPSGSLLCHSKAKPESKKIYL